jgi:hypothetical protein
MIVSYYYKVFPAIYYEEIPVASFETFTRSFNVQ